MWRMLQQDKPEDFVLATGKTTSVRDFIILSFKEVGIEIEFKGTGVDKKAYLVKCNNPEYQVPVGQTVVTIDTKYFRPAEVDLLIGEATKAKEMLGWEPTYDLEMLVKEMMEEEMKKEKINSY